jgi:hypothetical protein
MADSKTTSRLALGSGTMQEIYLGLLWLGTSMYTEHMTLKGNGDNLTGALGAAAAALPGVVAATLVTSAGIANAASSNRRTAGGRLVVGLLIGVFFGAVGTRTAATRRSRRWRSPWERRLWPAACWRSCPARCSTPPCGPRTGCSSPA